MSRTREIKGWIYNNGYSFHERFPDNFNEMVGVSKATLIIELPERKVTISESDFDGLSEECESRTVTDGRVLAMLKSKLFKDTE